jgi:hypothetical protein
MTRTKIAFLVAAAFAFTLTVQGANSASLTATGALKENAAGANLVKKAHGRCHTNCRWGRVQAGSSTYRLCHRNAWSCAFATQCAPTECRRWWRWWQH